MINNLLWVGLGGAAGSIIRYLLQRLTNLPSFPFGTLLVNISGCLLIGLLWGALNKNAAGETGRLFLVTGFCGGFTTFSAFTLESLQLMNEEKWLYFFVYLAASIFGGLLATFCGFKITN